MTAGEPGQLRDEDTTLADRISGARLNFESKSASFMPGVAEDAPMFAMEAQVRDGGTI